MPGVGVILHHLASAHTPMHINLPIDNITVFGSSNAVAVLQIPNCALVEDAA